MIAPRRVAPTPAGIAEAIGILRGGGLVAIPTDTVYGLAVDLATPGGVERLFAAKARPPERAIVVLIDAIDQLASLVEVTAAARALGEVGWPGGLTLVLPLVRRSAFPAALTAGTATLGVRIPDHPVPRALARAVGPLPTTSANRTGEPDARTADAVAQALGSAVDLIVDGGPSPGGVPSTVVDCTGSLPRILRAGAIDASVLARSLDRAGISHDWPSHDG